MPVPSASSMPRVCTICSHGSRHDIDSILVDRSKPYRDIARRYDVSKDAISRHVSSGHISELVTLAADAERGARADTLLDRIEALQSRTLVILEATDETHDHRVALSAIREARRNLELIGEVTKELDRAGTINLELTVEWQEVKAVLVNTLASYPE